MAAKPERSIHENKKKNRSHQQRLHTEVEVDAVVAVVVVTGAGEVHSTVYVDESIGNRKQFVDNAMGNAPQR
jgi:hypothetical protein